MKTELLIQLDGLIKSSNERVFLLAASNLPWELDMALLRRLEKRILVNLPSLEAREDMIHKLLDDRASQELDYHTFAQNLEGYSGSDIKLVCKEAAMKPLRRLMNEMEASTKIESTDWTRPADPRLSPQIGAITNDDFADALSSTKAAAQAVKFDKYEKWMAEFGSL